MKLTSMKVSAAAKEKAVTLATDSPPEYPWGLRVNLDNDALEKLGLTTLPKVGTAMVLHANVEVYSVSEHEAQEGGPHRSLELQITELALGTERSTEEKAARLYSGSKTSVT